VRRDLAQYCQPLLIWRGRQSREREIENNKFESQLLCQPRANEKKGTRPAALRSRLRATRLGVKQRSQRPNSSAGPQTRECTCSVPGKQGGPCFMRSPPCLAWLPGRCIAELHPPHATVAILNPQKRLPVQRALVEALLVLKLSYVLYRSVCRDVQVGVARAREQRRLFRLRRCSSPCGHAARPTVLASAAVPVRRKKKRRVL
jgi:hypothetical protein